MPPGSELSFCSNISSSLHQCNMEHSLHTPSAVSRHFMHVQNQRVFDSDWAEEHLPHKH